MAPRYNTRSSSLDIPEGWVLNTRTEPDGTEVRGFLCPETEQEFLTYEDLMRCVRYAKAAKLSIYAPDSEFSKQKRGASSESRMISSPSPSSNSTVTEHGEKVVEFVGCPCQTEQPDPVLRTLAKKAKKRMQAKRK